MKSSVFWDITPCSPAKVNFLEEYIVSTFSVEEWAKQETTKKHTELACCLLHAGFLLGLNFDSKDRGHIFLRNVR
jgi:hypothetical protein